MAEQKHLSDKLIRLSAFVIVLSLIAIGSVFTWFSREQAYDRLAEDVNVLAKVIGERSTAALVFQDQEAARRNLDSTSLNGAVTKACLYDLNGKLFASFSKDSLYHNCEVQRPNLRNLIEHGDEFLSVHSRIIDSGETLGLVSVYATTDGIDEFLKTGLLTIFIALLVIALVSYSVLRRWMLTATLPLRDLHRTALTVAQNPFSGTRAKRMEEDEVGRLVDVFNSMLDTLDKENEALLLSQNRFRSLAESSPVGIYQMDQDHCLTYVNETWHNLTGLSEGIKAMDFAQFIKKEESDLYLSLLEQARESRRSQVIEYRFVSPQKEAPAIFMEHIAPLYKKTEKGEEFAGLIGSLLDISDLKDAQMELENLAFYDPLTNLPNRRFFRDHLRYVIAGANKNSSQLAILMLDLDNFKKVNDTLGHDAGDELLVLLSERLKSVVSKKDMVSRMGGDEFMVLLQDIGVRSSVQRIADRILKNIQQPLQIKGQDISVSASIGVATYPEDAESEEELIRSADLALYESKEQGRNQTSFFSAELQQIVRNKVEMERSIRAALSNGEFTFFVQPQWDLLGRRLSYGEVLIRWFDADRNFISPAEFIPLAEENGQILEIGDWLLEAVISSISRCSKQLEAIGMESIAINLSARQLFDTGLISKMKALFNQYDVDPRMIELELTESAVMEDIEQATAVMHGLKDMGCRISIDDFGTGYSSLAYLKRFPIDAVKIDRSFIDDIPDDQNDMEISSAIIAMSHSLGLEVVAEGVETKEQLAFLIEKDCDIAQGYFIAKPMPFEEIFIRSAQIVEHMNSQDDWQENLA